MPLSDRSIRPCREPRFGAVVLRSVQTMSVARLVQGLVALLALLVFFRLSGGIGSFELFLWLGLATVWVAWWTSSRRRQTT